MSDFLERCSADLDLEADVEESCFFFFISFFSDFLEWRLTDLDLDTELESDLDLETELDHLL